MKVLIACEESQRVTEAFRRYEIEAYSCDIIPCSGNHPEWHITGSVLDYLDVGWDLMIAHPPCTYLTVTGNKWFKPEYKDRFPDREEKRQEAIQFFKLLYEAPISKICIENPVGVMSSVFRKPDQYIQPYWFGDTEQKKTGLWLKNLPPLYPLKMVKPEIYIHKNGKKSPMWHRKTLDLPAKERSRERSKTFEGVAAAMAYQWGIGGYKIK